MKSRKIRYAVVGLGHIAQNAVLPGFLRAAKNSELAALVSSDPEKLRKLSRAYQVGRDALFSYDDYEEALGRVDAAYIALPNHLHHEFTVRAAQAGVHVLCEKPLGLSDEQCGDMVRTCAVRGTKLMTAYRLHFQAANLEAIRLLREGRIGAPRLFNALFSMKTEPGNIRLRHDTGGGSLYDLGVYCINAARHLFQDEPHEVLAATVLGDQGADVETMTSAILRFSNGRLASFTSSFATANEDVYTVLGEEGKLTLYSGYEYEEPMRLEVTAEGRTRTRRFRRSDQFGAEIAYFSDCILNDLEPEPSGQEGWIDVRIIDAIYESAALGESVPLPPMRKDRRPSESQRRHFRRTRPRELVHVSPPAAEE